MNGRLRPVVESRARRNALLFGASALVLAFAAWCITMRDDVLSHAGDATTADDAVALSAPTSGNGVSADRGAVDRVLVASETADDTAPSAGFLHVRLRGLHPGAPWTAKLRLGLEGTSEGNDPLLRHRAGADVDADGRCRFPLPSWCATATEQHGRLHALDEWYERLDHRWSGPVDMTNDLVLDVRAKAILEGRVVDPLGKGVIAVRVAAFGIRAGTPMDGMVGETDTRAGGTWRMRVPPGVPLLIVAQPMAWTSPLQLPADSFQGLRATGNEPHATRLPASIASTGHPGTRTKVPDLVLREPGKLTGTVRWRDGKPIPKATVRMLEQGTGPRLTIADDLRVHLHADGSGTADASVTTDAGGAFRLPARNGTHVTVSLRAIEDVELVGGPMVVSASPPEHLELVLPPPTLVRVERGGVGVASAVVEVDSAGTAENGESGQAVKCAADGQVALVLLRSARIRAHHSGHGSPSIEVDTNRSGTTVVVELADDRGKVLLGFEDDFVAPKIAVTWREANGRSGRMVAWRDRRSGYYSLFLAHGRYHLSASDDDRGGFLLSEEREIVVGDEPVQLVLPGKLGGTFQVLATDDRGLFVTGTCVVRDANGQETTAAFVTHTDRGSTEGRPGELLPGGSNRLTRVLPPGDYDLKFDFGALGLRSERITIREREVTDVRVQL